MGISGTHSMYPEERAVHEAVQYSCRCCMYLLKVHPLITDDADSVLRGATKAAKPETLRDSWHHARLSVAAWFVSLTALCCLMLPPQGC
jgi:hypothetical protein